MKFFFYSLSAVGVSRKAKSIHNFSSNVILSPEPVPSLSLSPLPVPSLQGVVISQQKTAQGQTLSIQGAKVLKLHFREKTLQEQLKQHEQRTTEKQTHQRHIRDTQKQTFDLRRHPYFSLFLWGVAMLLLFLLQPRKQK